MARINYYFSVLSPFTYLAGTRLEEVALRCEAQIRYRPMDIFAVFAETGGVPVPKRHRSRQEYRLQELQRFSARYDLPINLKPAHWPAEQMPASRAIIATQAAGMDAGPLSHALLRAVWSEQRDVGDERTVAAVLTACGIDTGKLAPQLAQAETAYQGNAADAIAAGVFGSPFYIVGEQRFWGQDRLPQLEAFLQSL